MRLLRRILLFPFSYLYCFVVIIRNQLYDRGFFHAKEYQLPVISIGNITVGGTGKTPLTEYLLRLLKPQWRCALLSRGYGRKTKGVIEAGATATAATIGDEPMQIKQKMPETRVVVAEKRVLGMEHLISTHPTPGVVLLDDAFQHRALTPGFSILVMDYFRPVYRDICLPAGNLREPASQISRAHLIVVNKCPPDLSNQERARITQKLKLKKNQQIFFSSIGYLPPRKMINSHGSVDFKSLLAREETHIVALAGIGNPTPFFNEVKRNQLPVTSMVFPDHHNFTPSDLKKIEKTLVAAGGNALLLLTEKDAIRLQEMDLPLPISEKSWYLPIQLRILFNQQEDFNKIITDYVKQNQRNRPFSS